MDEVSQALFEQARKLIPGGVNSPVRACASVDSIPLFIKSAAGSKITSVDGRTFVDFVLSWGAMLLGHAHPEVTRAISGAAAKGSSYGAPCEEEVELARLVTDALPSVEMVRMVNSGTEATMSALRLARGVTGRTRALKFIGCYHGHADPFLAAAGSGVATLSIPGTPGVPPATVADTLLAPITTLRPRKRFAKPTGGKQPPLSWSLSPATWVLFLPGPVFWKGCAACATSTGAC